jgi:hypothetical protein
MAQLASVASNYPGTQFDTLIPELTDVADIREAFLAYHFGVSNFNGSTDIPAEQSIHQHIQSFKNLLETIESNAVITVAGVSNQISVSASVGFVTIGLSPNVDIANDLTVGGNSVLSGTLSAESLIQAKKGINIYSNASSRNSSIPAPVEGVIAYTSDNDEISIYNGTSWVGIESHGTLGDRIDTVEVLALLGL